MTHINERPEVSVEYFVPDLYKEGGSYRKQTVSVYRIDLLERVLITTEKQKIDLGYIADIDGEIFREYEEF
jgi:hypothetical protein